MREIKFRGKAWFGGEWHYGLLAKGTGDYTYIKCGYKSVRVDPETVGQFTGLLDRDGNAIWEGDVFSKDFKSQFLIRDCHLVVEFLNTGWAVSENMKGTRYSIGGFYDLRVIGNIHDNPELICEK